MSDVPASTDADVAPGLVADADAVATRVRNFHERYLDESGASGYVVGLSGGLDSTLAARLAVSAVGPDRVTGVILPGEPSAESNMVDARDLARDLGIEWWERDIAPLVRETLDAPPDRDYDRLTVGNVRARVRMVLLYRAANARDLLVVGPDNRSEYLLGYFTKYGDGAADVRPFAGVYKTELYDLARHVGVAERVVEKTPTAELWEGQTDEEELGADYSAVDAVLSRAVDGDAGAARIVDETGLEHDVVEGLLDRHRASRHKRTAAPAPAFDRGTKN